MKRWMTIAVAGCVVAVGGCAGVNHRPVPPNSGDRGNGIRYYQTSRYLLVYADGKGGLAHELLVLPDPTKKMMAEPYADLASLNMELKFTNGALTSTTESADASKVPAAIVKAVSQFLPTLAADAVDRATTASLPAPRLYKIIVLGGVVRFVGVEPTERLQIVTKKGDA